MERLTKYDNSVKCYLPFSLVNWDEIKIMTKLGELEDVLEKYGIENAEELKQKMIVPKFDCRQEIFFIDITNQVISATIHSFDYYDKRYLARLNCFQEEQVWLYEEDIFATREEAEKELKGE